MKINFTKLTKLSLGAVALLVLASCYTIGRVVAPKEVAGNAAYEGRIVAVNDGNNATQTGLSFFAVRVPSNWNVTVDEKSYKQYALPGTLNDEGEEVNMERPMRYCKHLANSLNSTNPKDGYTWYAFQTVECIRRNIQGSAANGADSICFDYKVINDGVEGTYELDYMIGSWEVSNPDTLDYELISFADMAGSDIYRVGTENTNDPDRNFNTVIPEKKTTITVLPGGTPVDNSPKIEVTQSGNTLNVDYFNMIGGISVYKEASKVACDGLDYNIVGLQKLNSGSYTLDITTLEPGVYHMRSNNTSAKADFTIADKEFKPTNTSLCVIGGTRIMAPELLTLPSQAWEEYRALDAAMFEISPTIIDEHIKRILEAKPSAVLVPGDLTMEGEKVSHEHFTKTFKPLLDAGIKVLVVPGDKDVNNVTATKFNGETTEAVETVTPAEFASIYADYGYGTAVSRDETTLSYMSYPTRNLAVLALDACLYNQNGWKEVVKEDGTMETVANVVAEGALTEATLNWAANAVKEAHATDRQVVVMMHHLVTEPFNGYATLGNVVNNTDKIDLIGSILGGGASDTPEGEAGEEEPLTTTDVQDALGEMGVDVVFCGDANATDAQKVVTTLGKSLYQVATCGATAYNCPERLVTMSDEGLDIQTRNLSQLAVPELEEPFETYPYNATSVALKNTVSQFTEANWEMIHAFLLERFTFPFDPEVDPFDKNMFFVIPDTPEKAAAIVNDNIIDPLVDLITAFADGNEHMKKSAELVANMHTGVDGAISGINTFPSVINPMIKEGFAEAGLDIDAMVDAVAGSLAYNYLGEPYNVTNDLFLEIPFSQTIDGIKSVAISNGETTIYNIAGQKLQTPAKGINIINGKKLIVK